MTVGGREGLRKTKLDRANTAMAMNTPDQLLLVRDESSDDKEDFDKDDTDTASSGGEDGTNEDGAATSGAAA